MRPCRAWSSATVFALTLGAFTLVSRGASAQAGIARDSAGTVRGTVVDSAGRPIEGVEVYAITSGRSSRTGLDGRFNVSALPPGATRLVVRKPGLRPVDTSFVLARGALLDVAFRLRRLPTVLDTMRVISQEECPTRTLEGFSCRRRVGVGVFRDSAELASLKAVEIQDLAWGIEGIRKRGQGAGFALESTAAWRCILTLYDGKAPIDGDNFLLPKDVIALEYFAERKDVPEWYRSIAFQQHTVGARAKENPKPLGGYTPGSASFPGRDCSLLVLWTRHAPRFDPRRDQSKDVKDARRRRALLDSIRG